MDEEKLVLQFRERLTSRLGELGLGQSGLASAFEEVDVAGKGDLTYKELSHVLFTLNFHVSKVLVPVDCCKKGRLVWTAGSKKVAHDHGGRPASVLFRQTLFRLPRHCTDSTRMCESEQDFKRKFSTATRPASTGRIQLSMVTVELYPGRVSLLLTSIACA